MYVTAPAKLFTCATGRHGAASYLAGVPYICLAYRSHSVRIRGKGGRVGLL